MENAMEKVVLKGQLMAEMRFIFSYPCGSNNPLLQHPGVRYGGDYFNNHAVFFMGKPVKCV